MNPSASRAADLFACGVPFRTDVKLAPDVSGPPAKIGQAIDRLVTAFVDGEVLSPQEAAKLDAAPEEPVLARWPYLLEWLANNIVGTWLAQPWIVWNARTDRAELITEAEGRKSKRKPFEVSCKADLLSQTGPDEATVWDIKTGAPRGAKPEQLLTLAVGASRHFAVSKVKAGFVFAHEDGVSVQRFSFSAEDLDEHAVRYEAYLLEIPTAVPMPGNACRFCRVIGCDPGDEYRRRLGWPLLKTG